MFVKASISPGRIEFIGEGLKALVVSLDQEKAAEHLDWLAHFAGLDVPASSEWTRNALGATQEVNSYFCLKAEKFSALMIDGGYLRFGEFCEDEAMSKQDEPATVARKLRMDAQRNRERILEVARDAFTRHGPEATLDDIARRAEIGPGTLYRHFPTRDALIEAVYRSEVEKLTAAGQRSTASLQPLEALRDWMLVFIDYVAKKLLILPAMDTVPGGSMRMMEGSRGLIHGTFRGLIERAIHSGDLRADVDPDDLIRAFVGVFHTTSLPGWESSARRIVDILMDGSRRRR